MEYLEGYDLMEYVKSKGGKIEAEEALKLLEPVFDCLIEMHKHGILHRDISPDNIYITTHGKVKLLDFGASRFAISEKSKSLSVILKPGYAPPEQYSSRGKQGTWTDVYALAATLYRVIMGNTPIEAVDRQMNDSDFENEAKLVPEKVRTSIIEALVLVPEKRTRTVMELKNKLYKNIQKYEKIITAPEIIGLNSANGEIAKKKNRQIILYSLISIIFIFSILIIKGVLSGNYYELTNFENEETEAENIDIPVVIETATPIPTIVPPSQEPTITIIPTPETTEVPQQLMEFVGLDFGNLKLGGIDFSIYTDYSYAEVYIDGLLNEIMYDAGNKLWMELDYSYMNKIIHLEIKIYDDYNNVVQRINIPSFCYLTSMENISSISSRLDSINWLFTECDINIDSLCNSNKLEVLIAYGDISGDLSSFKNLRDFKYVDLYMAENITGDINSFKNLSNLQVIKLSGCDGITGDISSFGNLYDLLKIDIGLADNVKGDISSLENLRNLQSVDLSNCGDITGSLNYFENLNSLKSIGLTGDSITGNLSSFTKLYNLQSIDLANCYNIKGDISLLASIDSLQEIELFGCDNITGNISTLKGLSDLHYVSIWYCDKLTGTLTLTNGTEVKVN